MQVTEYHIELGLVNHLENLGSKPRRQVPCDTGVIDVLTERCIYEVENLLNRPAMFEAVGQLTLYRQAVDTSLRPVIVGRRCHGLDDLYVNAWFSGIAVVFWHNGLEWPVVNPINDGPEWDVIGALEAGQHVYLRPCGFGGQGERVTPSVRNPEWRWVERGGKKYRMNVTGIGTSARKRRKP